MPEGHRAQFLPGFVEELVVSDDPEYKWIDKIRTPRASNEARQLLFNRLSGEVRNSIFHILSVQVRRKIGLKALELGGKSPNLIFADNGDDLEARVRSSVFNCFHNTRLCEL